MKNKYLRFAWIVLSTAFMVFVGDIAFLSAFFSIYRVIYFLIH